MARIDNLLKAALKGLPPKPPQSAKSSSKKRYSELLSQATAQAFADELRQRGMKEARPAPPGHLGPPGAERRMAGGIGAKKVDVTWATEEAGLLLAISIKSINFKDEKSQTFQKNLTNRRGDLLFESVTLHRRFPYAVLVGLFFLDKEAANDGTNKRRSTFINAHARMRLFTGRSDPAGRDEQYERLYILLLDASPASASVKAFEVGHPDEPVPLAKILDTITTLVAERNPDFYEVVDGNIESVRS